MLLFDVWPFKLRWRRRTEISGSGCSATWRHHPGEQNLQLYCCESPKLAESVIDKHQISAIKFV